MLPKFRGFILGERRSGSNLLRITLNRSSYIAAPHPTHIIHVFHKLAPEYGDFRIDDNWLSFVSDIVEYINLNPVPIMPCDDIELTIDNVIEKCNERSLLAIQDAVYRTVMEQEGKTGWICKSNDNIHYLPLIEKAFGDTARYLFLVRDLRDVRLSFSTATIGAKNPWVCAKEWQEIQKKMLAWEDKIGSRVLRINYESLITNLRGEVKRICTFLGVPFEKSMLKACESPEAKRTAIKSELWKNVDKPVKTNNFNKYLNDTVKNVKICENVAGETLVKLGYELLFNGQEAYSDEQITKFREEDVQLRKEIAEAQRKDGGNREYQAKFLKGLRRKMGVSEPRNSKIAGL